MNLERNIGWLAGAIDGEGWFGLCPKQDKRVLAKGRPSLSIRAALQIENTSESFVIKVQAVLTQLGFGSYRIGRNFGNYKKMREVRPETVHGGGKDYYRVAIERKLELKTLIETLLPELTAKVLPAQLVHDFLARSCAVPQYRPTIADLELCRQLNELQGRRGKPFPMERWISQLSIDGEPTPYEAEGSVICTSERLETRDLTNATNNGPHERPAPHLRMVKSC